MSDTLIRTENLCKYYRPAGVDANDTNLIVKAVDKVNLDIKVGEYVAIIGPSGSGKSTLMQMLGLLDRASSGKIFFLGKEVSQLGDDALSDLRSLYIGFVFQSFNLLSKSTAYENVELPLIYAGKKTRRPRVNDLLAMVGLEARGHHFPDQLSGGQQQRVAVARSLANSPPVIFADEPTGNLNQETAKEVMAHLSSLHEQGVTIILVTHDPGVAAHAKRVITVQDGKIFKDTGPKESPVTKHISEPKRVEGAELRILYENLRMAFKSLAANKLRSALSTLGILIGIASVITMVSLGQGAQKSMEEDMKRLGSNLLSIRAGNSKLKFRGATRAMSLSVGDAEAIHNLKEAGAPIESVSRQVDGNVQLAYQNRNWVSHLYGVDPEYEKIFSATPRVGRFFTKEENEARARVCLIGQTVYEKLFDSDQNPVGSEIKINRNNYRVLGILPSKGGSAFGDADDMIAVPFFTGMHRVLGKERLDQIGVQLLDYQHSQQVMDLLTKVMRERHKLRPEDDDDFSIRNMADIQEALSSTTKTMSLLLGIIASISLFVGGIGIMNIMLVSVKERTREIGLRKALGAKNRHILLQFLVEAVAIGVLGGVIGITFGALGSLAISTFLGWQVVISQKSILVALSFSFAVGVLFGFWPAKQAADLSPIEALRNH